MRPNTQFYVSFFAEITNRVDRKSKVPFWSLHEPALSVRCCVILFITLGTLREPHECNNFPLTQILVSSVALRYTNVRASGRWRGVPGVNIQARPHIHQIYSKILSHFLEAIHSKNPWKPQESIVSVLLVLPKYSFNMLTSFQPTWLGAHLVSIPTDFEYFSTPESSACG